MLATPTNHTHLIKFQQCLPHSSADSNGNVGHEINSTHNNGITLSGEDMIHTYGTR